MNTRIALVALIVLLVGAASCEKTSVIDPTSVARSTTSSAIGTIRYVVMASEGRTTDISYTDRDGDIIKTRTTEGRWETTFVAPLSGIFQVWGFDFDNQVQPVSCELWVDGKLLADNTARPREMAAGCTWSP